MITVDRPTTAIKSNTLGITKGERHEKMNPTALLRFVA